MRLVKASFEIIEQKPGLLGVYKQIELAGRTCYKSEDKITENSAEAFVDRMYKSNHTAMLEHGTIYLKHQASLVRGVQECDTLFQKYKNNKFSYYVTCKTERNGETIVSGYVTTNFRVIVENGWMSDLQYMCEPTEWHEKRVTVRFITDQGILREFTRHRVFSFAVESTRYCNYGSGKFNNEVTYILPPWLPTEDVQVASVKWDEVEFIKALADAEKSYFKLLELGWKPQQARNVLPLGTKCEIVMTGFVSDWEHFFDLRAIGTTGTPHPQASELAIPLLEEFKKLNYV